MFQVVNLLGRVISRLRRQIERNFGTCLLGYRFVPKKTVSYVAPFSQRRISVRLSLNKTQEFPVNEKIKRNVCVNSRKHKWCRMYACRILRQSSIGKPLSRLYSIQIHQNAHPDSRFVSCGEYYSVFILERYWRFNMVARGECSMKCQ